MTLAANARARRSPLEQTPKSGHDEAMTDDAPANPNLRRTERSLPIALLRARETVMAPIREMLATSNINEQKWRVLRVLQERGPSELTLVAKQACLLLPSLTRIIRAMEQEGLITRQTDLEDRRKAIAAITPAGAKLIRDHSQQSSAILTRLERDFGPERLETLLDLLESLQKLNLSAPEDQ